MATIPDMTLDAGMPANVDAEKTILGAILLDNAAHSEASERLDADDFSLDSHRRIFLRMSELMNSQRAVDIVTLSNELTRHKEVESVGGVAYLASLTEGLPRRPVIEEYIRIVKDKSLLRKLMLICSAAIARAADQSETALEVLGAAETQLLEVGEKGIVHGLQPLDQIVQHSFGTIDNLYKQSRAVTGLATDFTEFDRMTSGLQKGELITGHQYRAECGGEPQRRGGGVQPGDEQGGAVAPHVGLAGLGGPAQSANRLHSARRSRQTAARPGAAD
jgi:replicative DNA helicase